MRVLRVNTSDTTYCFPFAFLATVPLGFAIGGPWSFLTVVLVPLTILTLDSLLGTSSEPAVDATETAAWRMLPRAYILLQIAITAWAAFFATSLGVTFLELCGLTLSVGLTAGIFGMVAAHEMIHSRSPADRAIGLAMLAIVGYMHFRIAHIYGHHLRGATRDDPATARRGEGLYRFIMRSVTGQFREAWTHESNRLRRHRIAVFSFSNRMLQYLAVETIVVLWVSALGPRPLLLFVVQGLIAVFLLELFNYIAHYGLERRTTSAGRVEQLAVRHSWNSSRQMNNWSLFNMGRHSDHHRRPSRSYQRLEQVRGAPELPFGYAGTMLLALAPPLWRSAMDSRSERIETTSVATPC